MRTLLVCSPGGHFRQLEELRPRMGLTEVVWAVSENPQVSRIVGGDNWVALPDTPSRDWLGALRLLRLAARVLKDQGIGRVVSTGALPAVPFFVTARSRGIPCYYVESAARSDGPSLSGRLVSRIPGVSLYTQYPAWADDNWRYGGSVFDGYATGEPQPQPVRRVVVTLGVESFGFRRALLKLLEVLPAGVEVLWQTGSTDTSGLPIDARPFLPSEELSAAMAAADLVVAHSGVGSALTALDAGKTPFLLPREQEFAEHVDDHQFQIARDLGKRGLAPWSRVEALTWDKLLTASTAPVMRVTAPDFILG